MTPRIALLVAGLAAVALAFPGPTPGGVALAVVTLAALWQTVARPGSQAPALFLALTVLEWLIIGAGAGLARLIGVTAAVAAVHHTAALAAVTPPRTRAHPSVVRRWVVRWAATTGGGVLVVAAAGLLPGPPPPAWTTVAAVIAVGAGVVALAVRARRLDTADGRSG
jgi:hypothetical protein